MLKTVLSLLVQPSSQLSGPEDSQPPSPSLSVTKAPSCKTLASARNSFLLFQDTARATFSRAPHLSPGQRLIPTQANEEASRPDQKQTDPPLLSCSGVTWLYQLSSRTHGVLAGHTWAPLRQSAGPWGCTGPTPGSGPWSRAGKELRGSWETQEVTLAPH